MLFCLRRQPETRLRPEACRSEASIPPTTSEADGTVPRLVINHVEIHIQRIVIHHLLEFANRYSMGRQVFDIVVIPFELNSAATIEMYRNVYMLSNARAPLNQREYPGPECSPNQNRPPLWRTGRLELLVVIEMRGC